MKHSNFFLLALLGFFVLTGCQIVYDDETANVIPSGPEGDEQRAAILVEETYQSKLFPHIQKNAQDIGSIVPAIEAGLDAAGEQFAFRGADQTAAWNFPVKGQGTIVAEKLDSRARNFSVDSDGDGEADLKLQLGPVIKGTALRDVAPFYDFNNFRDQIEFAKLGRVLNDTASERIVLEAESYIGQPASYMGVFPYGAETTEILVTPVTLELGQ